MKSLSSVLALAVAGLSVTGLAAPACAQDAAATPATVKTWLSQAEKDYFDQSIRTNRTEWVYQTNITYDTAELTSAGNAALTKLQVDQAKQAAILAKVPGLAPDVARKLLVIRTQITTPAPTTPGAAEEFAALQARVQGIYGKGHGTLNGELVNGSDIEEAMGTTRDPAKLKEMWVSWHDTVGTPMKADYVRMVDIANAGARELGFADTGALWRSNYDMDPDAFAALTEKIWGEVQPLYRQLHCYVRTKLNEKYGDAVQPRTARSAPTCWATCGRRNGATSMISSLPPGRGILATMSPICWQRKATIRSRW